MSEKTISKKQIAWQCRRGMLELDMILNRLLNEEYDDLTDEYCQQFSELLKEEDTTLWRWLVESKEVPTKYAKIIERLNAFK